MPVTAAQLSPAILSQLNARGLVGPFAVNLASGVAVGIQNIVATYIVQGTAVGVIGGGTGTGKWTLDPVSGSQLLDAQLQGSGLPGTDKPRIAQAVAFGAASVVNTGALVQTAVVGVAAGTELGTIINLNPPAAIGLIYQGLTSFAIVGPKATNLATALGTGLTSWFGTGLITNVVAGAPVFPFNPTTGVGIGKIN